MSDDNPIPPENWNPFEEFAAPPAPPLLDELVNHRLGMKLRSLRQYAGYTQRGLAAAANVTQKTISSIESGAILEPYDITLDQLASALARPEHMSYTTAAAIAQELKNAKRRKPIAIREMPAEATILADRLRIYPPPVRRALFIMLIHILDTIDQLRPPDPEK